MSESTVSHQLRIPTSIRLVGYHQSKDDMFSIAWDDHVLDLYPGGLPPIDEPGIRIITPEVRSLIQI